MAVLYVPHFIQFLDDDGNPLSGGKLYTYEAGTTTPKATYTDAGGGTSNSNPVILDSAGRATVFLSGSYKFSLYDSSDVLVEETDNVVSFATASSGVDTITTSFTEDVVAAGDSFIFSDASDSDSTKRDTIQGILDLVPAASTPEIFHAQHTTTGTTAAGTATSGSWIKRTLNTEKVNEVSGATLTSSVISLPAGTYEAHISSDFYSGVQAFASRLRDTTNSATLVNGMRGYNNASASGFSSVGYGKFTLSGTTNIELQYRVQTTAALGLGDTNAQDFSETNIWADVYIRKVV